MDVGKAISGVTLLVAFGVAGAIGYSNAESIDASRPADVVQALDVLSSKEAEKTWPNYQVCILQAKSCLADSKAKEVRPPRPLPAGCTCRPWDCPLPAGAASAAQDLSGDLGDGLRVWRVLVATDKCEDIGGLDEVEFAKVAPAEAVIVEASGPSCGIGPDGKAIERCKLKASVTTAADTVYGKAGLAGSYAGHECNDAVSIEPASLGITAQIVEEDTGKSKAGSSEVESLK